MALQGSLLGSGPEIEGLLFRENFITPDEELDLWTASGPSTFTR